MALFRSVFRPRTSQRSTGLGPTGVADDSLASPEPAHPPPSIRTLDELDWKMAECDRATSDDQLRQVFATFRMDPPAGMPDDPFSAEYREFQLDFYSRIAGKAYEVANEATVFDVADAVRRPFPYCTGSSLTTGESLISTGFILRAMDLPPASRVLELGSGWGTMTAVLAMLGHSVTAVDTEERFCELLRRRADHDGFAVTIVHADFSWVEQADQLFDTVLFTSSFHHSADHLGLLRSLHRVVTPQGRIFFGSEPIQPDLSYPWGVRLDGQSLWSIRKHGWLELGFSEDYFAEALKRTGWFGRKHAAADPPWLTVWEGRRRAVGLRFTAANGALKTQAGICRDGCIIIDDAAAGAVLFGPYIDLPADHYVARVHFSPGAPRRGTAVMDVVVDDGTRQVAQRPIDAAALADDRPVAELAFAASEKLRRLEVRLFCDGGFSAQIDAVEIAVIDPNAGERPLLPDADPGHPRRA
jgi:2-polyprenyl-3-methyl-5-hydroxy-6-metoxy-1,4-benzoquinol methylase